MGKSHVSDYGGSNVGRRVAYRKSFKIGEGLESYRCLDCHKCRFVSRIEWTRAARPRCTACGGQLDETKTTAKRHEPMRQKVNLYSRARGIDRGAVTLDGR